MGDPDPTKVRGPGLPGFADSFAASSRRPGERDRPHVVSRLVVVASVVVLVAAGAIGVGVMSSLGDESDDRRTTAASARDAADTHGSRTEDARPTAVESRQPGDRTKTVVAGGGRNTLFGSGTVVGPGGAPSAPSGGKSDSGSGRSVPAPPTTTSAPQKTTDSAPEAKTQASGTSESKSQPGVTGRIVSFDSGRCIDVLDGNPASGTPLQIWDCSDDSWQQWSFHSDGTVRSIGKCMQVEGGSTDDGAAIRLATCNGGAAQRFDLNKRHDLVNVHADKCVDVRDMRTGNGTRLQLYSCAGTPNQKWGLG